MDSWDDNGRLVKVGKVRIALSPNPFVGRTDFKQKLDVRNGRINIRIGGKNPTSFNFWINANHPVIQVETKSEEPVTARAQIEMWRTSRYSRPVSVGDPYCADPKGRWNVVEPDVLLRSLPEGRIGWYHRNIKSIGPKMTMEFQGLQDYPDFKEPLLHRTFGAVIKSENAKRIDDKTLERKGTDNLFSIYVVTRHPATGKEWLQTVRSAVEECEKTSLADRYRDHCAWWNAFWERSWISIHENKLKKFITFPSNNYTLRIGAAQNGQYGFGERIGRVSLIDRACDAADMARFAAKGLETRSLSEKGLFYSGVPEIGSGIDGSAEWGKIRN